MILISSYLHLAFFIRGSVSRGFLQNLHFIVCASKKWRWRFCYVNRNPTEVATLWPPLLRTCSDKMLCCGYSVTNATGEHESRQRIRKSDKLKYLEYTLTVRKTIGGGRCIILFRFYRMAVYDFTLCFGKFKGKFFYNYIYVNTTRRFIQEVRLDSSRRNYSHVDANSLKLYQKLCLYLHPIIV